MLLRFQEPDVAVDIVSRWRRRLEHALLIVDQFEELFTLNPPEVQRQVREFVGAAGPRGRCHVLLSHAGRLPFPLPPARIAAPVVADLTMLGPPEGAALRRALVQPAMKCGYRFEDDELVEEMHAEVEGERGALPLLAFAGPAVGETRPGERSPDTAGATRTSAASAVRSPGTPRRPSTVSVRRASSRWSARFFRNLVTAEGTRAVREWDELLSVFSDSHSESPEEVLRALIDARLLTSYETRVEEGRTDEDGRDYPRVAARQLATPGSLADTG